MVVTIADIRYQQMFIVLPFFTSMPGIILSGKNTEWIE